MDSSQASDPRLREALAAQQHEIWALWMRYLFSRGTLNDDSTWTMPAWAVERWQRQMQTPYESLGFAEQESDRGQADKILAVLREGTRGMNAFDWTAMEAWCNALLLPEVALRARIFQAVSRERQHQERKWGSLKEHPHTVGEWLLIMDAELQEAKQAWVKGAGDDDALRELLQVVAVGVAAMEQHGVVEREQP